MEDFQKSGSTLDVLTICEQIIFSLSRKKYSELMMKSGDYSEPKFKPDCKIASRTLFQN